MKHGRSVAWINSTRIIPCCLLTVLIIVTSTFAQNDVSQKADKNSALILTNITVNKDRRDLVADLSKAAFTLYDNKEEQEISYFTNEDQPISIGVVADGVDPNNETQPNRTIKLIAETFRAFLEKSSKSNEYFLIGFNKEPQLFVDWTINGNTIADNLLLMKQSGPIGIQRACLLALEKLSTGKHKKKALLIILNGGHIPLASDMKDLKEALRKSDVLVYFAFPPTTDYESAAFATDGYEELAGITGGNVLDASLQSPKLFRLYLEHLAVELRHQYVLGFVSKSPNDGKYHSITVKVAPLPTAPYELRNLKVRNRKGYLAISN